MPAPRDWAFDVQSFFQQHIGNPLGFDPDHLQRYPDRLVGTIYSGTTHDPVETRTTILLRGTGPDNAETFRRWVTLLPAQWSTMGTKPKGWRYLILQIGLQPDGQPYWANLYDEAVLAPFKEHAERMGGFVRFDPGLTVPALLAHWDPDEGGHVEEGRLAYGEQQTGVTVDDILDAIRADLEDYRKTWDHGNPAYRGMPRSSKAAMLAIRCQENEWPRRFLELVKVASERSESVPSSKANGPKGNPAQLRLPG